MTTRTTDTTTTTTTNCTTVRGPAGSYAYAERQQAGDWAVFYGNRAGHCSTFHRRLDDRADAVTEALALVQLLNF